MKAIMIMFDSLNRHMLPPYGCDWIHAPNFQRLAEKTVTFENCYVGSMPCMPARRELHTGRYNFLHASWGPLEPFDDSMPELLKTKGIHTHLVSDHYHYWEDGGCTYHPRYSTWEISRGQEGDPWKGEAGKQKPPDSLNNQRGGSQISPMVLQDWINRQYIRKAEDFPQAKTFQMGMEFIENNNSRDQWFLQIETFDPHEPYFSPQNFKNLYPHTYEGPHFDWPLYRPVQEDRNTVEHVRYEYAALLSMCDYYLGQILDKMDQYDLWKDTMLIVNTDHGFLLGEHGWWAKCAMPFYNEIAHIPLFIYDPRIEIQGERRKALVQTIDLAPTLLEFFDQEIPRDMQGKPLFNVMKEDTEIHEAILYGIFGGHVNVTDGRYVYMKAPKDSTNTPLYEYTLMPTEHGNRRGFMDIERLKEAEQVKIFGFTKTCPVLKIPGKKSTHTHPFGDLLFDLVTDPQQTTPIQDREIEGQMRKIMVRMMEENEAPHEQYERLGLKDDKHTLQSFERSNYDAK